MCVCVGWVIKRKVEFFSREKAWLGTRAYKRNVPLRRVILAAAYRAFVCACSVRMFPKTSMG